MKRVLSSLLIVAIIFSFASCGGKTDTASKKKKKPPVPEYISDREVEFHEEDNQFVVFFGLQDKKEKYIDASGIAHIVFKDDSGNKLYENSIDFNSEDFTDWTNNYRDDSRYLCGLYISKDDIKGGVSNSGVVSLEVDCGDIHFDSKNLTVYDLPKKNLKIKIPKLPKIIRNYDYDGKLETVLQIKKVSYTSNIYDYNGEATVEFKVNVKVLENHTDEVSSYSYIGYKLKSSDGTVVSSDSSIIDKAKVGETVKDKILVMELDPNDSYKLSFNDVKD